MELILTAGRCEIKEVTKKKKRGRYPSSALRVYDASVLLLLPVFNLPFIFLLPSPRLLSLSSRFLKELISNVWTILRNVNLMLLGIYTTLACLPYHISANT